MLTLDQLVSQKVGEKINGSINVFFNNFIKKNPFMGLVFAPFVIFIKCVFHTIVIMANTIEYALRGLVYLFSAKAFYREYFSTLGSFLVINTMNAATVIPDFFIRTYFVLKDSKIDPVHTQYTLYYKIMRML